MCMYVETEKDIALKAIKVIGSVCTWRIYKSTRVLCHHHPFLGSFTRANGVVTTLDGEWDSPDRGLVKTWITQSERYQEFVTILVFQLAIFETFYIFLRSQDNYYFTNIFSGESRKAYNFFSITKVHDNAEMNQVKKLPPLLPFRVPGK